MDEELTAFAVKPRSSVGAIASVGDPVLSPGPADGGRPGVESARFAGADHVGLGSDFDGATKVPFDASQLVQMTQALLDELVDPHLDLAEREVAQVARGDPG